MMRLPTAVMCFLCCLGYSSAVSGPDIDSMALDEQQAARLKRAVTLLDSVPATEDVQWLRQQLTPGNEPVNILAAAILYASDTSAYRDELFEYYSVADYAVREREGEHIITRDEFVAAVARIEEQMPEELVQQNLMHLFGYWYFRNRNEWFQLKDQTISAARFFRTSSLAAYIGLPQTEAIELAARIDRSARAMSGSDGD